MYAKSDILKWAEHSLCAACNISHTVWFPESKPEIRRPHYRAVSAILHNCPSQCESNQAGLVAAIGGTSEHLLEKYTVLCTLKSPT